MIFHFIRVLIRLLRAKGIFTAEECDLLEMATREDDYAKSYPSRTIEKLERICEENERLNKRRF